MPSLVVTEKYKTEFMMADATFKHQIIFDPFQRRSMPLTPISDDINPEYLKNAGKQSDDSEALQMALGNIHPHTKKRIHNFDPDVKVVCFMFLLLLNLQLDCKHNYQRFLYIKYII